MPWAQTQRVSPLRGAYSWCPSWWRLAVCFVALLLPLRTPADVAPVSVRLPATHAWIGQRVVYNVELRALGSFAATASFDLPQLPGVLLIKIGSPVVSSQEIEGRSWFVQTHEFALFAQKPGRLEIPAFAVRFANRSGFSGPATDTQATVPAASVEIQRPPGSEQLGFLVTTESLDVSETWDPLPGPAQFGAVFKRSITQRAPDLTGMALAPAPANAADGIRVYPGKAETHDKLERGEFLGERRETLTYLLQKSGTLTLPAITYVWWNPRLEELQSTTLPAVSFTVAPPPVERAAATLTAARRISRWLFLAALLAASSLWQRRRLGGWLMQCRQALNPPERVAARALRRACRRNDATAATHAWNVWRSTHAESFAPTPELGAAVLGLQRQLYGPAPEAQWQGAELARAFDAAITAAKSHPNRRSASVLPPLNP